MLKNKLQSMLDFAKIFYKSGQCSSSATKGSEREFFIKNILQSIIAPPFRIGSGDIIDSCGKQSGQNDTVIEYSNSISIPMAYTCNPRLYLAEGVCAIIEVKSNIRKQWNEVKKSYKKNSQIKKMKPNAGITFRDNTTDKNTGIPFFVIGYEGWKTNETLKDKYQELIGDKNGIVGGILILNSKLYIGKNKIIEQGPSSLFTFLCDIQNLTNKIIGITYNYEKYKNIFCNNS